MTVELTQELAAALYASGERGLERVDPQTRRTHVLVDVETHQRAMQALDRQQSHASIKEGWPSCKLAKARHLMRHFRACGKHLDFPRLGKLDGPCINQE